MIDQFESEDVAFNNTDFNKSQLRTAESSICRVIVSYFKLECLVLFD